MREEIKRIKGLKEELARNDEILRKNKEEHKSQVRAGLVRRHFPSSLDYELTLKELEYDAEELKIKLESGVGMVSPMYEYQKNPRWIELQEKKTKNQLKLTEGNAAEIRKNIEEVENEITAQNGRITERRVQIIEELKELGEDISEIKNKSPNYIG